MGSNTMHSLCPKYLCDVGKQQAEDFSQLKQLTIHSIDVEGREEFQPEGHADQCSKVEHSGPLA